MSTKTAVAGRFQSHGEDFIHYVDESGNIMSRVGADGIHYCVDIMTHGGVSLIDLQNQVTTMSISGLPTNIDVGTF